MPGWPQTLPQYLLVDGYNETAPNDVVRSATDTGPPMVRRRSTAGVRPISGSIMMDTDQREILDTFYLIDLVSGVNPFDWVHPATQLPAMMRMAAPPSYSVLDSGIFKAGLSLEILAVDPSLVYPTQGYLLLGPAAGRLGLKSGN